MSASKFEPCPQDIKDAVARAYAEHTGETYEEVDAHNPVVGLVRGYMTDGVGFGGDLVVIIWPADPGAVTIFGRDQMRRPGDPAPADKWVFINQTNW